MQVLDGQCAIVTGAAGSLGIATAWALTKAGANVVPADICVANEAAATCPNRVGGSTRPGWRALRRLRSSARA